MKEMVSIDAESEAIEAGKIDTDKIIRDHLLVSMGVGLVPIPFIDFVGGKGVQLNLIRKLAQGYDIPFSNDMVKNCLGALISGVVPASAGVLLGGSMAKLFPGVGHITGALTVSAVAGASTYAVGKVFNRHFAEGGSFLSFDPQKAKSYYEEMFKEGREIAGEIKKNI